MGDFNKEHNISEEDFTLAEWVNDIARHVSFDVFSNQENVVYMANERGAGRNPMTKPDAVKMVGMFVDDHMAVVRDSIVFGIIKDLHEKGDIDLDADTAYEYNMWYGLEGDEEVPWKEDVNA